MRKHIKLIRNHVDGVDLEVERDCGNMIRILTGNRKYSRQFWENLQTACMSALDDLDLHEELKNDYRN